MKFELMKASEPFNKPGEKDASPLVPKAVESVRKKYGKEHRVWEIEINSLEELMDLVGDEELIISKNRIIIYDDYVE